MGLEIERKYLVNKEEWEKAEKGEGKLLRQGYIANDKSKTIRVRLTDVAGFLTIKSSSKGATRSEYEYGIPKEEANELLDKFANAEITKVRYKVIFEGKTWEVDEFFGDNEGLIIAEIELVKEDESYQTPKWISQDVTHDEKYYNANLSVNPFRNWKNSES